jgi:hypothetical protein
MESRSPLSGKAWAWTRGPWRAPARAIRREVAWGYGRMSSAVNLASVQTDDEGMGHCCGDNVGTYVGPSVGIDGSVLEMAPVMTAMS